jgi:hypothetical protein
MANIMSSLPSDHTLLGGHAGAMLWLRRFMDLLPPIPASPLPLLTAPVLVAFLTGAGHMLANRYPEEFAPLLDFMRTTVVGRLDDSTVGIPSATRLRKVLDDVGFEGMRTDLPNGAVAGLYDDGKGGGSADDLVDAVTGNASAFAQPHITPTSAYSESSLGGGARGGADASSTPSATLVNDTSSTWGSSSYSFADGDGGGGSRGFGTATAAAPSQSPFGGAQSSLFGTASVAPASAVGFAPATTPRPFGGASQASGFGMPPPAAGFAPAATLSPFGGATQASGFGVPPPAATPSPFGSAPAPSMGFATAAPSPFGIGSGQSSGFGSTPAATSSSFGPTAPALSFGAVQAPASGFAPSIFGSTAGQQTSPFGLGGFGSNPTTAPAPSPFGNNSGWQGLGANTGGQGASNRQPCKFFASGKCNLGDQCKFSHETPIDGVGNPSPFSNQPVRNPPSTFGRGDVKQPCKFFASGQCRNGSSCRFSHEQPGGAGASGFGSGTSFVGGGFGQASNPSPFSGGGGSSGIFGASPFGSSSSTNPFGGPRR